MSNTRKKVTNSTAEAYKIRLNEKLTVKKVNAILDAIDRNNGYCPCQEKSKDSKCHCKDFLQNKKIGEPCICKIFVKKAVATKKLAAKKRTKEMSKLKSSDVTITDCSEIDSSAPMTFLHSPHGPVY